MEGTYIVGQLAVVQVTLEQDQFAVLQVAEEVRGYIWHAPVASWGSPEGVRTDDQLSFRVEVAPVVEEEFDFGDFLLREGVEALAGLVGGSVEGLRVGEGGDEGGEVRGSDVGDEPGDVLGVEDDSGCEAGGEEVAGEDEVDEELEAGVVEDDVDAAILILAVTAGLVQDVEGGVEVVDEDILLRGLAGFRALELLDVFVGEGGEEGEVSGIAPEADLAHLGKEDAVGLLDLLRGLALRALACFLGQFLVSCGEFEDGGAR